MAEKTRRTPAKAEAEKKGAAAKKPAAAKKAAPKKAAPKKKAVTKSAKPAATKGKGFTAEERWRMISEAAYFIAEKQNFGGDPASHWLKAELQIDARLKGG